jgi:hypothetical protein
LAGPAGGWVLLLLHCVTRVAKRVRGLSPLARPRALRAETPSAATEQGRPVVGPLAVRIQPRQRYPTSGRPLGDPQPPETWPLAPAWRIEGPPPEVRWQMAARQSRPDGPAWRNRLRKSIANRWVAVKSARRVGGAITPERAGPRRAGWRGETARLSLTDAEGPHAGKRCRVAREGVASAASEHRHPRGKRKALPCSGRKGAGREPAWQQIAAAL